MRKRVCRFEECLVTAAACISLCALSSTVIAQEPPPIVDTDTMQALHYVAAKAQNVWLGGGSMRGQYELHPLLQLGRKLTLEKLDAIESDPTISPLEKHSAEIAFAYVQNGEAFADHGNYPPGMTRAHPGPQRIDKRDLTPAHRYGWEAQFLFTDLFPVETKQRALVALSKIGDVRSLELLEAVYPLSLIAVGAAHSEYILLGPSKWPKEAQPASIKATWHMRAALHAAVDKEFAPGRVAPFKEDKRTVIVTPDEEKAAVEQLAGKLDKESLQAEAASAEPDSEYAKFLKEMLDLKAAKT